MAMELRHEFTVPATLQETWAAFNDIESVAACFPGATVSSVEADTFQGSCKVKLGPIALVYNGSGTFIEKDEAEHRMVIDAKGKDKRGNGTAGAHVRATMTEAGNSTHVEVLTDLNITGKPAQFGRGVMQEVSDKLLGQFTACLEKKVGDSSAATADAAAAESAPGAGVPDTTTGDHNDTPTPDRRMHNLHEDTPSDAGRQLPDAPREVDPPGNDEALDLGATVLPVIAKAYWKQAVSVVVVVVVLLRLAGRRR